jgi:GtrA-like protein
MQHAEARGGRALSIDRWLRFGAVGVLNFFVDYGLFLLLFKLFGVQLLVANSIGILVAATTVTCGTSSGPSRTGPEAERLGGDMGSSWYLI